VKIAVFRIGQNRDGISGHAEQDSRLNLTVKSTTTEEIQVAASESFQIQSCTDSNAGITPAVTKPKVLENHLGLHGEDFSEAGAKIRDLRRESKWQ
jgi:hypothetical protein